METALDSPTGHGASSTAPQAAPEAQPGSSISPVVWVLAAVKLGLHLVSAGGYGWHGDELYYKTCAEHLAWGYVDHPPLSITVMALWSAVGGDGMVWTRMPAAFAGTAVVVLTALIARELGGRGWAQGLAALVTLAAGGNLVMHGYASMNAFDAALWATAMWLALRIAKRPTRASWLALGAVMGFGLLDKWTVAWLGAGLFVGLLLSSQRRLLAGRDAWFAVAIACAVVAPNVAWQVTHDWPTLAFIGGATTNQMLPLESFGLGLLGQQVVMLNPVAAPVWLVGLVVLLRDRDRAGARVLGIAFLVVCAILLLHGASKPYYLTLAQPPLVAAGSVWLAGLARRRRWARAAFASYAAAVLLTGAIAVPLALRLLPPAKLVAYQAAVAPRPAESGPVEDHFAIHFGWPALVDELQRVVEALPAEQRNGAVVFTPTYADASAIEQLGRGRGLPPVISGHNNYWLWGPPEHEPTVVIIVGGYGLEPEVFKAGWARVEEAGRVACTLCGPTRDERPIWLATEAKAPIQEMWPHLRHYD